MELCLCTSEIRIVNIPNTKNARPKTRRWSNTWHPCLGWTLVLLVWSQPIWPASVDVTSHDVTAQVERLGNPLTQRYPRGEAIYARNVWDLQAFDGRLYLGAGNSSNIGPAQNAGPVPVVAYVPETGRFQREFIVEDEQIDRYYVFDNALYLPGHDPRESWQLGNLYRLQANSKWKKYRTIPGAIHTYALAFQAGVLYAGLGTGGRGRGPVSALAMSIDKGKTWTRTILDGYRIHSFLRLSGHLYATDVYSSADEAWTATYEIQTPDVLIPRPDLDKRVLLPDLHARRRRGRVVKPASWGEKAVYIGAYRHNDHQFLPVAVYIASSLRKGAVDIQRLPLPRQQRPWDLLVREGVLYVLLDEKTDDGYRVRVLASDDGRSWQEMFSFRAASFARSFELLNGDWYFGLGCTVENLRDWQQEELHPDTGTILRVRGKYLKE